MLKQRAYEIIYRHAGIHQQQQQQQLQELQEEEEEAEERCEAFTAVCGAEF